MPPPVRACLFDMDGLLIDSEDLYTLVTNLILREYGRPDIPWSIKAQLQGRPGPAAGEIFHEWAQLPISREEFLKKASALQAEHFPRTQPLPGVETLLKHLKVKGVHIALATSSHEANYKIKTNHLQHVFDSFKPVNRVLGDDKRVAPGRGKPSPDIYLLALKTINDDLKAQGSSEPEVKVEECLVFEDSVPGIEAGRRAGMQVVWCPHPGLLDAYKDRVEEVLSGKLEGVPFRQNEGSEDEPWAIRLETLENFPYERYGIDSSPVGVL